MDTPICDFVSRYEKKGGLRLHMPGHKGTARLGMEPLDITEILGADELYHARGIIRQSEENASSLFGTGKTFYSTEGSSLCVRAMVYLALLHGRTAGRAPLILAGRNAHKAFLSACALLDASVEWLYPQQEESLIACGVTPQELEKKLASLPAPPAAVYLTSPDYLGHLLPIAALARVCHGAGVPLLVDNAHGAYLKFLEKDEHPITQGADMCCDSAHKTLPVLTGGAYLHIRRDAPADYLENGERALSLFASTSPSYLILQSLDACCAALDGEYPRMLQALAEQTERVKRRLRRAGYALVGGEPLKITLAPKAYGCTGDALHDYLRENNMECEFSDPDFLTAMLSPTLPPHALEQLEKALLSLPRRAPILQPPPAPPHPRRALSIRQVMLAPAAPLPVEQALGRVLADAQIGCPPCVPILACGEIIDRQALRCFQYYGIENCRVVV